MLGSLLLGGAGLYNMYQGNKKMSGIANNQPSGQELRDQSFGRSQGLIDRMTNFNQYSGQAMDLASQQGNKGVEDAMMMGMGGSQANAIKNRMKRSSLTGVYDKFNQGMQAQQGMQQGIDNQIFGRMNQQQDYKNDIGMMQANAQMGLGSQLLPEGGIRGLLGQAMGGMGIPT